MADNRQIKITHPDGTTELVLDAFLEGSSNEEALKVEVDILFDSIKHTPALLNFKVEHSPELNTVAFWVGSKCTVVEVIYG